MGNLYSVLGVPRDASSAAIKAAYYRLAKQYHPDTHAGEAAQQRIREVNEAYQVLSDSGARAAYDLLLDRQRAVAQTRLWRGVAAGAVAFALTFGSVPLLVLWQQSRTAHTEARAPAGSDVAQSEGARGATLERHEAPPILALRADIQDEIALTPPPQPSVAPAPLNLGSAQSAMRRKQMAGLVKWQRGVARTRSDTRSGAPTAAERPVRNYRALRAYVLSK
jgi:hypothetical protein